MPQENSPIPDLLAPVVSVFDGLIRRMKPADPIWTCNGGALVLDYLCRRAGIRCKLQVGLYWWPEERRVEKWEANGCDTESPDDYWLDEHHHWVEITDPRLPEPWIIDPNGEVRHQPRAQSKRSAGKTYQAKRDEKKWSGIGPGSKAEHEQKFQSEVAEALRILADKDAAVLSGALPDGSAIREQTGTADGRELRGRRE